MSYILDALKRAEAERERGAVPGLNAQPTPLPSTTTHSRTRSPLLWALALVLSLCGAASFWWLGHSAAPAAPSVAVAGAPVAAPTPTPTPVPAMPGNTPAAVSPSAPTAPVPPPPVAAAPTAVAAVGAPAATPAAPTSVQATAKTTGAVAAPASKLPMLSELPAELRSQLPKMTITGAVYSKDPAQRLLLINNQVFTQGGNIAPGLDLEEIQPHSAILNFQGTRFSMAH